MRGTSTLRASSIEPDPTVELAYDEKLMWCDARLAPTRVTDHDTFSCGSMRSRTSAFGKLQLAVETTLVEVESLDDEVVPPFALWRVELGEVLV